MVKDTKKKNIGQVFTPPFIVNEILDYCGYNGQDILQKHIIDNSCGDGAFLTEVVTRYCNASITAGHSIEETKKGLETYIHGIDNDVVAFNDCIGNLNKTAEIFNVTNVNWDLYNQSSLSINKFNGLMDFVVGNPPYVRVHNLDDTYEDVKQYKFANGGMTDLYLAFFELGFNMLNNRGQLCYITPSSWLNSVAALNMRKYILKNQTLVSLVDLGHFQAFKNATAYTIISHFSKAKNDKYFDYYTFNEKKLHRDFVEKISLDDCYIDTYFYLSTKTHLSELRDIKTKSSNKYVSVKNGFATLADDVFIGENIPDSSITINVLKASTGKWYKCIYPYDKNGKPLRKEEVFADSVIAGHFNAHKEELLKGKKEYEGWWEFGRTQALLDVSRKKMAINCLCRTSKDLKIELVREGEGIYSGIYIVTDYNIPYETIEKILRSEDFVEYIKLLKKYKSGGYYTYNTKDVEQYINYYLTYNTPNNYVNESTISGNCPTLF